MLGKRAKLRGVANKCIQVSNSITRTRRGGKGNKHSQDLLEQRRKRIHSPGIETPKEHLHKTSASIDKPFFAWRATGRCQAPAVEGDGVSALLGIAKLLRKNCEVARNRDSPKQRWALPRLPFLKFLNASRQLAELEEKTSEQRHAGIVSRCSCGFQNRSSTNKHPAPETM